MVNKRWYSWALTCEGSQPLFSKYPDLLIYHIESCIQYGNIDKERGVCFYEKSDNSASGKADQWS